jgi:hypothetical protein
VANTSQNQASTMSSQEVPDIHAMSKSQLHRLKKDAKYRREEPSAFNNYFTVKFETQALRQPDDWISCPIAPVWCVYHGPCHHATEDCKAFPRAQQDAISEPSTPSEPASPSPSPKPSPKKRKPSQQPQLPADQYLQYMRMVSIPPPNSFCFEIFFEHFTNKFAGAGCCESSGHKQEVC